jgi:flagellar basal body-associated protein FliL
MGILKWLNKKAQGLPMETIIIIILVVLVLAVVAYIFFVYTTGGQVGFTTANKTAQAGVSTAFGTGTKKPWE